MRTRMTAVALALVSTLSLGGVGGAEVPADAAPTPPHQALHTSMPMMEMHEQMPADMQLGCDAMHAQMSAHMGSPTGTPPAHDHDQHAGPVGMARVR